MQTQSNNPNGRGDNELSEQQQVTNSQDQDQLLNEADELETGNIQGGDTSDETPGGEDSELNEDEVEEDETDEDDLEEEDEDMETPEEETGEERSEEDTPKMSGL